jgi:SNF2 family DNA or RNA helicase
MAGRDAVRVGLQACKAVVAAHRLILSGTPVQNSIGELWGLFDWLMPGFLGSEKVFQVHASTVQQAYCARP